MNKYNKQTGAVLVVSLVLLTVLTLIGVASMSSSSLEMRIAGNAQQQNIAFQAVQSRLDFIASDDPANPINFKADSSLFPMDCNAGQTCPDDINLNWIVEAEVAYSGACGKSIGSSLEEGKGLSYRFFDVSAEGRTTSGSSYSVQQQGVQSPAAAC